MWRRVLRAAPPELYDERMTVADEPKPSQWILLELASEAGDRTTELVSLLREPVSYTHLTLPTILLV